MYKYYVFKIKTEYVKITRNNVGFLYDTFNIFRKSSIKDFCTVFSFFDLLTGKISEKILNTFLFPCFDFDGYQRNNNIHSYYDYFSKEKSILVINDRYLIIESNKKDNIFINKLRYIPNLFLCDFSSNIYFYLDTYSINTCLIS